MRKLLAVFTAKPLAIAFLLLLSFAAQAQKITGTWYGELKIQGQSLLLIVHVQEEGSAYKAKMDIPAQGAKGLEASAVTFSDNKAGISFSSLGIEYSGVYEDEETIKGEFKQNGLVLPLDFSKSEPGSARKSQEPKKPYPYYQEDVTFENKKAGISLSGTLTMPAKEGKYPAIILISGSGPQNRDSELLGHKPFLVLSDFLTRAGYAVLRYDDRGVEKSQGIFKGATTADFATDAASAVNFLKTHKNIDAKKIGIAGHSEGGVIGPMVAAGDKDLAFLVLMAGPGLPLDSILILQKRLIQKAEGIDDTVIEKGVTFNRQLFAILKTDDSLEIVKSKLTKLFKENMKGQETPEGLNVDQEKSLQDEIASLTDPWFRSFVRFNPAQNLHKVTCPVLAINGSKDLQVPAEANLTAIKKYINEGGNKKVTTKELPGLNHLFQEATTGAVSEYGKLDQTFSPTAMQAIVDWLKENGS